LFVACALLLADSRNTREHCGERSMVVVAVHSNPVFAVTVPSLFCFVRHPESAANVALHEQKISFDQDAAHLVDVIADPAITETGLKQAVLTVDHLSKHLLMGQYADVHVFSSNLDRTRRISELFVQECAKRRDSVNWRDSRNDRRLQEYTKAATAVDMHPDVAVDESAGAFVERVHTFFNDVLRPLATQETPTALVVFGHSQFFAALLHLMIADGDPLQKQISKLTSGAGAARLQTLFELPNCSITTVQFSTRDNNWHILGVGRDEHLAPELKTGRHSPL
jgi:broad specificity phosphatase PhoE